MIPYQCQCGKVYFVDDGKVGAKVRCKACGLRGTVPPAEEPVSRDHPRPKRLAVDRATLSWLVVGSAITLSIVLALAAYLVSAARRSRTPALTDATRRDGTGAKGRTPTPTGKRGARPGAKPATLAVAPASASGPDRRVAPPPLSAKAIFAQASPSVVRVEVRDRSLKLVGQGSGFFVSGDGWIVTNYHVVKGAHFALVKLANESQYWVEGVGALDRDSDLALLKVNGKALAHLTVAPRNAPAVGSKVYAIGSPQGLTNTLSEGLVSGQRDVGKGRTLIQTTAAISPGSSGGPLLSVDGKVVGVMTLFHRGGQNLNFAVPADRVAGLIQSRGKLEKLGSAGGGRIDRDAAGKLDAVWGAIREKDYGKALRLLGELRKSQAGSAAYWFAVGFVQGELGNHQLAVDAYRRTLSLSPQEAAAYNNMGNSYGDLGQHQEAIAAYKSAIALYPKYADAYYNLGLSNGKLGQHQEAIAAYKSAIALDPKHAKAYLGLGITYAIREQHQEAIAAHKSAIALDPESAAAYLTLGIVYRRLGNHPEAMRNWRRAAELDPTGEEGKEARKLLGK